MVKNSNYIVIQGFMIKELNLKGAELIVYAIIYGFSQDGKNKYNGSREYLASWCNATERGIGKVLKKLVDKGLIEKEKIGNKVLYRVGTKFLLRGNKVPIGVKKVPTEREQSSYNNIDNNIEDNIEINRKNERKEIFEYDWFNDDIE